MDLVGIFLLTAVLFTMITFLVMTSRRVRRVVRILRHLLKHL